MDDIRKTPVPHPLSREERIYAIDHASANRNTEYWYQAKLLLSYEATCRALEREVERLRAELEEAREDAERGSSIQRPKSLDYGDW